MSEEPFAIDHEAAAEREAIQAENSDATTNEGETDKFSPPGHWKRLDVAHVRDWVCTPLRPIVADMFAHGNFVFIAAQSQTGKTLFGLHLARRILQGGALFGKYQVTPVDRLMYLLLEDPDRRAQDRLLDNEMEFPENLKPEQFIIHVAPSFTLNDDRMFAWLEDVITSEKRDVIILDTYQKATPGIGSFDDEKQALILHKLANLTRRLQVTLIVMDHFRKDSVKGRGKTRDVTIDDLKGTGGKAQNADCVILMERTGDRKQIRFQVFSKDFDNPVRILLNVAPRGSQEPKFTYAAELEQLGAASRVRVEVRKRNLVEAMKPGQWLTKTEIGGLRGIKTTDKTLQRDLTDLVNSGHLDSQGKTTDKRYCRRASHSGQNT